MPAALELAGSKFGRLCVIKRNGVSSSGKVKWLCHCDCGNECTVIGSALVNGNTTSCGCYRNDRVHEECFKDLTGQVFGELKVMTYCEDSQKITYFECKCSCGQTTRVRGSDLVSGKTRSCGHLAGKPGGFLDLTNRTFGRLTVIKYAFYDGRRNHWLCRCTCGTEITVLAGSLVEGQVKSCGCLRDDLTADRNRTHGMSKTRIYKIWQAMKQRCNNPIADTVESYWSLGITYCDEWETFEPFYEWAQSAGYEEGLSLDRRNPFCDYEPDNCRWIWPWQQAENKRENYLKPAREALAYALYESCPSDYQDNLRPILLASYDDSYFSRLFKTLSYDALDSTSMKMLEEFLDAYCTAIVLLNLIAYLPTFTQNQDIIDRITANAISICDTLNSQFITNNWPLPAFQSKEV